MGQYFTPRHRLPATFITNQPSHNFNFNWDWFVAVTSAVVRRSPFTSNSPRSSKFIKEQFPSLRNTRDNNLCPNFGEWRKSGAEVLPVKLDDGETGEGTYVRTFARTIRL